MRDSKPITDIVILPTKISVPSRSENLVARVAVASKLNRVLSSRLTTVISPAGYGKTSAVVAWARSLRNIPIGWFLLDAEDQVIERFWLYLTSALRFADENICHTIEEVGFNNHYGSVKPTLDALIVQMTEYGKEFVCVLEDFHTVQKVESINESVAYLVKHAPSNAHFVITSRQALCFPTSKMKVEGSLSEITEEDLVFSLDQTAEFFSKNDINTTSEEVALVHEVTRGWPTGTRLIGLWGSGSFLLHAKEALFQAKENINDYLFEEVLLELPLFIQQFMVKTSAVSSFTITLTERMVGCTQAEAVKALDYLLENNLFIEQVKGGNGEAWYRYHLLLVDMLHQRLERMDRHEIATILHSARDWFAENAYLDYVVELSATLEDYEAIKMTIIKNWKAAYMEDRFSSPLRWSSVLPEKEILKSPALCAILVMPYALNGEIEKAKAYLANAEENLHDKEDFLYAFCLVQKAYLATFRNDSRGMSEYSEKALRYLPQDEDYLRGMMRQMGAASCFDSDPLRSKELSLKAVSIHCSYGNKTLSCTVYSDLAIICGILGHLEEARHYTDLAFGLYSPSKWRSQPVLFYAYLAKMICAYEEGDFSSVIADFEAMKGFSNLGVVPKRLATAQSLRAKALFRLGIKEGKSAFLSAMLYDEVGALTAYPSLSMAKAYCKAFVTQAINRLSRRSKERCVHLFELMLDYHIGHTFTYEDLHSYAESINPEERYAKLHALVLAAVFAEKLAYISHAETQLSLAIDFARTHRLTEVLRGNAEYLQPIARRLMQVQGQQIEPLLKALATGEGQPLANKGLSDRERDVMRLIAAGSSMPEVATMLFISRDTVKKHVASVYAKLGVHSKLEAVAILRESGLV